MGHNLTQKYISIHPNICHGKPCFRGTRIPIYMVIELLEAGQTKDQIIKGYPQLTKNHINAALHFAAELLQDYDQAANA